MSKRKGQKGIVLVMTLGLMVLLLTLLAAFTTISNLEIGSFASTRKSTVGFYAAEAGLNLRAEEIRQIFVGYNRPSGTSPASADPCSGANQGAGNYQCQTTDFGQREVKSYVEEEPGNPLLLTIPPGELYQNLSAQEYRYTTKAVSYDGKGKPEALLELRFKSRLVPLFQFVSFYDKDLEILPGATMNLSGPVHTNGDLYLNSDATLNVTGQVTTAGTLYRGRKNDATCVSNSVLVRDPATLRQLVPACPSRTTVSSAQLVPFNGMIQKGVSELTVPPPESIDPTPGEVYWDYADLRLVLQVNASGTPVTNASSPTGVQIRNASNVMDATLTSNLHNALCTGSISGRAIGTTASFYNNRESKAIRMLEVDMQALLNCIHRFSLMGAGKTLNDSTEGGLVFYVTVDGPNSGIAANNYGVRVRNATALRGNLGGIVHPRGMTIVTNQGFYTYGDFNLNNWIPAAIMADSFNVLSRNWRDPTQASMSSTSPCPGSGNQCSANTGSGTGNVASNNRVASSTSVYAAVLSGTDTTGGPTGEGAAGQGGAYNGGLENYPRFHEYWTGITFTYRGSFVSLSRPRHVNGVWVYGGNDYTAPNRNWDYDTRFNNAANLPPLSPRFVYLRQELFVRDFEQ